MRTPTRFRAEARYSESADKKANVNLPVMAMAGNGDGATVNVAGRANFYWIRLVNDDNRLTQCYSTIPLAYDDVIYVRKVRDRKLSYYELVGWVQDSVGGTTPPVGLHDLLSAAHDDTTAAAPTRGDVITAQGAAPNTLWTALAAATAGAVLIGDGADVISDTTPTFVGLVTMNAGLTFGGASGVNVITVPDNVAQAAHVVDVGGLEYLRFVSTNANPGVLLFPSGGGRGGLGTTAPSCALDIVADAATAGIESTADQGQYLLRLIDRGAPANFWGMYFSATFDLIFRETGGNDRIYFMAGGDVGINTATVPHGGIGHGMMALDGANASDAGPHIQFTTATDNYPIFGITPWSHDDIRLYFDCYRDAASARIESSDAGSNFLIQKVNDVLYWRGDSGNAQGALITWDFGIAMSVSGDFYPIDAKTQDLGLPANEWDDLYWVTSNQGTSRLVRAKRICPVCQTEMSRGTGGLVILGEAADYVLCFCLNCGSAGVEELNHLPSERVSQKQPPPKIMLKNVRVKSAGRNRSVAVDFQYGDDVVNNGEIIERAVRNSTRLGEYEVEEFLAMSNADRLSFLLALGQREWYAREESRLMQEEAKTFKNTMDAKVNAWIGKNLLEVN